MKQISILSILALAAVLAVFSTGITSCKKDPCKKVTCQNDGICVEGVCDCDFPYEGEFCEKRLTAHFTGLFMGNLTCAGSTTTEAFTIDESQTHAVRILFTYGTTTFYGEISDTTNFTIPPQNAQQGAITITVEGFGSQTGNQMSMTFTVDAGAGPITCTYQGTRQ